MIHVKPGAYIRILREEHYRRKLPQSSLEYPEPSSRFARMHVLLFSSAYPCLSRLGTYHLQTRQQTILIRARKFSLPLSMSSRRSFLICTRDSHPQISPLIMTSLEATVLNLRAYLVERLPSKPYTPDFRLKIDIKT